MEINPKVVKWIRIGIELAFIIVFAILCITVNVKNRTIKTLKQQVRTECLYADSLQARCERYGQMEGISVSTTFVINNKNIMSLTSNVINDVTRNYAVMTKQEVLNALDSLQKINNNK